MDALIAPLPRQLARATVPFRFYRSLAPPGGEPLAQVLPPAVIRKRPEYPTAGTKSGLILVTVFLPGLANINAGEAPNEGHAGASGGGGVTTVRSHMAEGRSEALSPRDGPKGPSRNLSG